jgi:hypothetical protein
MAPYRKKEKARGGMKRAIMKYGVPYFVYGNTVWELASNLEEEAKNLTDHVERETVLQLADGLRRGA